MFIATVSGNNSNIEETLQNLKFANIASYIKTSPKINDLNKLYRNKMQDELEGVRNELSKYKNFTEKINKEVKDNNESFSDDDTAQEKYNEICIIFYNNLLYLIF